MKNFLILFFILFLNCISPRTIVKIDDDEFKKTITIIGIEEKMKEGFFSPGKFFIRSWMDKKTEEITHQIYIDYTYFGQNWRFYQNAQNQEAQSLEFIEIRHDVDCGQYGCNYFEIFGITITNEYLKNHLEGFSIKIYAKSGDSFIIKITSEQIKAQFAKIQEYKKEKNL